VFLSRRHPNPGGKFPNLKDGPFLERKKRKNTPASIIIEKKEVAPRRPPPSPNKEERPAYLLKRLQDGFS